MCRAVAAGGRRCTCPPEDRSARRRSLYAKQKADRLASGQMSLVPEQRTSPENPPAVTVQSLCDLAGQIDRLAAQGDKHGDLIQQGTVTPAGFEVEQKVRDLGGQIDRLARERAFFAVAEIDAQWRERTGFDDPESLRAHLDAEETRLIAERKVEHDKAEAEVRAAIADGRLSMSGMTDEQRDLARSLRAESNRLQDELWKHRQELHTYTTGRDDWTVARLRAETDALRSVLSDVRPMGPVRPLALHGKSQRKAVKALDEALPYFPTDWSDQSDADTNSPLFVRFTKGRAHYARDRKTWETREPGWSESKESLWYGGNTPELQAAKLEARDDTRNVRIVRPLNADGTPELWASGSERVEVHWERQVTRIRTERAAELCVDAEKVPGRIDGFSTAAHEFAHRCEDVNPRLGAVEYAFLTRRSTDTAGKQESKTAIYQGRREFGWRDGFSDPYIGKTYKHGNGDESVRHFEVLSMGVESLWAGKLGSLRGERGHRADLEHRHLVIGMLAAL